jgi:hypothetical protein
MLSFINKENKKEPQYRTTKEIDQQANSDAWGEFLKELEKINDEILPDDFPVRLKFRTPAAFDMNTYALDTSTVSYFLNKNQITVKRINDEKTNNKIIIPPMVYLVL